MPSISQPKGLEAWVNKLDSSPLPVLPGTFHGLKKAINKSDVSLSDLAEWVNRDPIMVVHLIRQVNRSFSREALGTLTNVNHCLSMLGLDRARTLISQFKSIKADPTNEREMAFLSSVMQSVHAAEQAHCWNDVRHQAAPEHVYLSSLLCGVPMWCLWCYAFKEMQIINTLEKSERIPQEDAERAVLGCSTEEIVVRLAKRWHFPENIINALDSKQLPSLRTIAASAISGRVDKKPVFPNKDETGKIVNTPSLPVALANWLVQEASIDWYSRQTRRCVNVVGAYLGINEHAAWGVIRHAAIRSSRRFYPDGLMTPASRLILPRLINHRRHLSVRDLPDVVGQMSAGKPIADIIPLFSKSTLSKSPSNQLTSEIKPLVAPGVRHSIGFKCDDKKQMFALYVKKMMSKACYANEKAVLTSVVDILSETMLLKRIVIGLVDHHTNKLNGYYAAGCSDSPELEAFEVALDPPNFFTHLLAKPKAIWADRDKPCEIPSLVPGGFKQAAQEDAYFVSSLFCGREAVAVLYADKAGTQDTLSETEFKVFKILVNACIKQMILISRRKARREGNAGAMG